ncbi:TrkA family potassium uptake protein [Paenibacillus rhizovicinus]|uniref:TrkA family potassium uptake protein n=2 Tax=Paenibacillus rhizovicinus TaxID=2704463 RepID=A0A6C0P9W1_9BACL|nr:TrkA family potassium uptake protein [Paenibacillus rhizovicinus]
MGRFGSSVAHELSELGFDVLAIDADEQKIQEVSNWVTHAVAANSTDEEAMRSLGLRNFDVVIVAIGEDIQASILTTLILKELGVPELIVKAQNALHGKVLDKIGANKVVFPERDMGLRVAHHLISPNILEYIELSNDYGIVEMKAPSFTIGKNLMQLDIRARYKCNVLAIKRGPDDVNVAPYAEDVIMNGDLLVIVGKTEDLSELELSYAEG